MYIHLYAKSKNNAFGNFKAAQLEKKYIINSEADLKNINWGTLNVKITNQFDIVQIH